MNYYNLLQYYIWISETGRSSHSMPTEFWERLGDDFMATMSNLITSMNDSNVHVRIACMLALRDLADRLGRKDSCHYTIDFCLAAINTGLADQNKNVRRASVSLLEHLGNHSFKPVEWELLPAIVTRLLDLLDSEADMAFRELIIRTLGSLGSRADAAVPTLLDKIDRDPSATVSWAAMHALEQIDSRARDQVSGMIDVLKQREAREKATFSGESLLDAENEHLAIAKIDELKIFYLVGKLYAEGCQSRNDASRILDMPGVKQPPDERLSTSPSTISRAFKPRELPAFFKSAKVIAKDATLFDCGESGGNPAMFTREGDIAWEWTDRFLRWKLGPLWWGFRGRLTPADADESGGRRRLSDRQ